MRKTASEDHHHRGEGGRGQRHSRAGHVCDDPLVEPLEVPRKMGSREGPSENIVVCWEHSME
ncbi:hypothetical protein CRUP_009003 [Coryphaenoides rupestris]|nr:hypothetical protein CRUP_009003 [Coryphaenoides rupestris]